MDEQSRRLQLWKDIEKDHLAFLERCDKVVAVLGGDANDSRPAAFMRVRGVGRTIAVLPFRANQLFASGGIQTLTTMWGRDQTDIKPLVRDLDTYTKISMITLSQFYLENMIHMVLEVHPKAKQKFGFKKAAKEMLRVAKVDDQKRKLTVLNLLAMLRNTMHREGVHTWDDEKIVIGDFTYEFVKGEAVLCSTWPHVYNALQASLDIYEEILLSEEISSLEHVPLVA